MTLGESTADESDEVDPARDEPVLFSERGASLLWLLAGPAAGGAMLYIQSRTGGHLDWRVPTAFTVLVGFFVGIMVFAARTHTSVLLTPSMLRQGAQTTSTDEILALFPPAPRGSRPAPTGPVRMNPLTARALRKAGVDQEEDEPEPEPEPGSDDETLRKWQSSRALGELTGVPRGRTPIGLQLVDKRVAQAWARDHHKLRAALLGLLERRDGEVPR